MIRIASLSDAHAIAVLHVAGWQFAYRGQLPDQFLDALSIARREAMWAGFLSDPATTIDVLSLNEQSIDGFVHYGSSRDADANSNDDGEVYAVYLNTQLIGQGHGRALMQRAEDALRAAGYRYVAVWVLESNVRARAFYEKMGFMPDGAAKQIKIDESMYQELRCRKPLG
jgi:ribosomal protein S18 acetylase RimI-like enzyme